MTQPTLFETEVLPLYEKHRPDWLSRARMVAHRLARTGKAITVNDVRVICPPPEGQDPRVMGAVFRGDEWENVGYTASARKTSHGRPVARFKLRTAEDGRRAEEGARAVFGNQEDE